MWLCAPGVIGGITEFKDLTKVNPLRLILTYAPPRSVYGRSLEEAQQWCVSWCVLTDLQHGTAMHSEGRKRAQPATGRLRHFPAHHKNPTAPQPLSSNGVDQLRSVSAAEYMGGAISTAEEELGADCLKEIEERFQSLAQENGSTLVRQALSRAKDLSICRS